MLKELDTSCRIIERIQHTNEYESLKTILKNQISWLVWDIIHGTRTGNNMIVLKLFI